MRVKKNVLWVVLALVLVNGVNGFLIENVTLSNDNNSVFVNDSMNMEAVGITSSDIDLYNATSTGQINNVNDSNPSTVNLHLKYPYNTVATDNTPSSFNVVDKNITIGASGWARIEGVTGGVVTFVQDNWEELFAMFGVACCIGMFIWYRRN